MSLNITEITIRYAIPMAATTCAVHCTYYIASSEYLSFLSKMLLTTFTGAATCAIAQNLCDRAFTSITDSKWMENLDELRKSGNRAIVAKFKTLTPWSAHPDRLSGP